MFNDHFLTVLYTTDYTDTSFQHKYNIHTEDTGEIKETGTSGDKKNLVSVTWAGNLNILWFLDTKQKYLEIFSFFYSKLDFTILDM